MTQQAHDSGLKVYFIIFASLLALTALTIGVAFLDLGRFNTPMALAIAGLKAVLVIVYFMHVRHSEKLVWVFVAAGFFWLAIMMVFTLADFFSRGWIAPPLGI